MILKKMKQPPMIFGIGLKKNVSVFITGVGIIILGALGLIQLFLSVS